MIMTAQSNMPESKMMTIFCDASVQHKTGEAGWGCWAKKTGWQSGVTFGGKFRSPVFRSWDAEILALANAVAILAKKGDLDGCSSICLQCDNLRSLSIINREILGARALKKKGEGCRIPPIRAKLTDSEQSAVKTIKAIVDAYSLVVLLRHVRGHREGPGRNWVNRKCDEIANAYRLGKMEVRQ